jgi:hypothetical protein
MNLREAAQQALEALIAVTTRTCAGTDGMDITPINDAFDMADTAITGLRAALAQQEREQEPVAWSTRERFYEALDRAVENIRQEMRIKTVTMRRKDHDVALPIIDAYFGNVLVGDPPRREWVSLTDEEMHGLYRRAGLEAYYPRDGVVQYEYERRLDAYARAVEAALRSKNHD